MLYEGPKEFQYLSMLLLLEAFAEGYTGEQCIRDLKIDTEKLEAVIYAINEHPFPHIGGVENASAFKKAAVFICCFIKLAPITGVDYENDIDESYQFSHILNDYNPNAVFALTTAIVLLNHHKLCMNGGDMVNHQPIALTQHSYEDILDVLSTKVDPNYHWHLLSLLLEQMFYKTNPGCQYDDFAFGSDEYIGMVKASKPNQHYSTIIGDE